MGFRALDPFVVTKHQPSNGQRAGNAAMGRWPVGDWPVPRCRQILATRPSAPWLVRGLHVRGACCMRQMHKMPRFQGSQQLWHEAGVFTNNVHPPPVSGHDTLWALTLVRLP